MTRFEMPLIDVMVCTTCELRCTCCTNHIGGLDRLELFPADEVCTDIDRAAEVIHAGVAVLLGGEPLQHPHLLGIMGHLRESGLADKVRVLTNGIRLHKMPPGFWEGLQDLKISVYPGKTPEASVELARQMQLELGFDLSFYRVTDDPFRAVLTPPGRSAGQVQAVYDSCWYRTYTRKIERGYLWRCCTSPAISKTVLGLPAGTDGLALSGATVESVGEFLGRTYPAEACSRCLGHSGPQVQWAEQKDRMKWLDQSTVV